MGWFNDKHQPDWSESSEKRIITAFQQGVKTIMAGVADIKTAQAAEHTDLATLVQLQTQLLTAFANGTLSPADAQAILDETTGEDSTVKTAIGAIQAALPPTPPTPPATS